MFNQFLCKILISAAMFMSMLASAKDQVMIMTISEYESSVLHGVKHDAQNALQLADAFGFDMSEAIVLRDAELTAHKMRLSFEHFAQNIKIGDRAFIYYSGHGASFQDGEACAQALVSQDEELIETKELIEYIDAVKTKVSDAVVVFDACHAGGNSEISKTRNSKGHQLANQLTAKVWTPKDGESCSNPVNVLQRSLNKSVADTKSMSNPEFNFTFLAAANEREVALDNPSLGGLATVGLLQCAREGVLDQDGSQSINYAEIVGCAQHYIEMQMPALNEQSSTTYAPQTIEIYGNPDRTAPVVSLVDSEALYDKASKVIAAFKSLEANSNGNWQFNAMPSEAVVKIGNEFNIKYQSGMPGYIYMLYVGSDHQDIQQIWPANGQHIQMNPGESMTPTLKMYGPEGDNTVLMLVSQMPVDFSTLFNNDGVVGVNSTSLASINCVMQRQRNIKLKDDGGCPAQKRNIQLKDDESSLGDLPGYSARLLIIRGVVQ